MMLCVAVQPTPLDLDSKELDLEECSKNLEDFAVFFNVK